MQGDSNEYRSVSLVAYPLGRRRELGGGAVVGELASPAASRPTVGHSNLFICIQLIRPVYFYQNVPYIVGCYNFLKMFIKFVNKFCLKC